MVKTGRKIEHTAIEFFPKKKPSAVIVVIWNEGERIKKQLARMQSQTPFVDIILADGGSSDGSTDHDFLKSMQVQALLVTQERGLGTALRMGFEYALQKGYENIITMDGNGKDGPDALKTIVEKLNEGFEFVQASRFVKGGVHKNTPVDRLIGIKCVISPVLWLASGFHFTDPTNGMKGFKAYVLNNEKLDVFRPEFNSFNLQFYLNYRVPKLGYKTTEIAAERVYPDDGTVPTKIIGLRPRFKIIRELIVTALGMYNPR